MNILCRNCEYARIDRAVCEEDWMAYECGNPASEFYLALLNVTLNGDAIPNICGITWHGCERGAKKSITADK